jgi:HAD superfamily hydrolase (TIGR01549 family)
MNNKILFVWDFHGVLEKDNIYAVHELVNLVLKDFDVKKQITIKQIISWYGLSWFDYFRLSAPEKDEKIWHKMVRKVISYQQKDWSIIKKHLKTRDYAIDVLLKIQIGGHHNIILSNTHQDHIRTFTDLLKMSKYFNDIIGVDTHQKTRLIKEIYKIKAETLKMYIAGKSYSKIIAIGDKESDIMAGKSCGAITYLFIDREIVSEVTSTKSDYITSDLREILKELV